MRFPVFVLCAALLVPTTTHAARPLPTDVESIELWFLADISIATDGRISGHAWRNFNDMPNAVLAALEQRIATWQFQPGKVDDVPAEIGTSLLIHAFAIESGDGAFALEIANAIVGPSLNEGRRPELDFPDTWRSAYGSGAQVFDVAVQPEREAAIRFGEYIADTRRPDFKAGFRERAADLVSQWACATSRSRGDLSPHTSATRSITAGARAGAAPKPRIGACRTCRPDNPCQRAA